jgi:hypothetical protein
MVSSMVQEIFEESFNIMEEDNYHQNEIIDI